MRTHPWPDVMLTERKMQITRLVAFGLSNQAIADQLGLSLSTIRNHLNAIYDRVLIDGPGSKRVALVRWYIEQEGLDG